MKFLARSFSAFPKLTQWVRVRRGLMMASLVLAGDSIYGLPYYLRRDYETALVSAMDLSRTELGLMSSVLGVLAMICYFPGGWLADRFPTRVLLPASLLSTACGGLVLATFPPYPVLLTVFGFFGVSSILLFWAALIKATRIWGSVDAQGRAFGILDGGRGLVGAALASVGVLLFSRMADPAVGVQAVIAMYVVANVVAALMIWIFVPWDDPQAVRRSRQRTSADARRDLFAVLRMPVVWLQALVIFTAYAAYLGTFDLAAYAVDGFQQTAVFGATVSMTSVWLRPVAALGAGVLADQLSASRTVIGSLAFAAAAYLLLALVPPSAESLWVLWAGALTASAAVFALRGVYFALLEEGSVPVRLTGTAVGVASVIGFSGDVVVPPLAGWLNDTFGGGDGHRLLYSCLTLVALFGVIAALAIPRVTDSEIDAVVDSA